MSGQKTVREWLEELPEPYRSQAIENLVKYPLPRSKCFFKKMEDALLHGFDWDLTPQGFSYWHRVKHGIIVPPPSTRQQSEALLMEYEKFKHELPYEVKNPIEMFLNQKYGS